MDILGVIFVLPQYIVTMVSLAPSWVLHKYFESRCIKQYIKDIWKVFLEIDTACTLIWKYEKAVNIFVETRPCTGLGYGYSNTQLFKVKDFKSKDLKISTQNVW